MIKCIVVDDEPIARKGIIHYVEKVSFLQLTASFQDGFSALEYLQQSEVDLMILDINMPELSGLELIRSITKKPLAVIISAHPDFAVESYALDVIDYIVKPASFDRFYKSMNKVKDYLDLLKKRSPSNDHFFIKANNKIEKISKGEILFVESLQNYVKIYTEKQTYLTLLTLKALEENLDETTFFKVHKSFIVNIEKVESIDGDEINIGPHKIPISRTHKEEVYNRITRGKILKR
ncbi:MAG: response regulator transcription factor [Chitinophagaceae bacterium]|nr:response regulator transcription factor [Chitinophagaceae bacterium]